ncbi:M24 family metallopeptidase [Streptosporangium sp. NPDC051023]|uniref:M24 family metallopeptidase n=1 Tax=Streptosporangium sp. NPDC051023 TaxID=3155410 RepID=UPI00344FA1CA
MQTVDEEARAVALLDAQGKAVELFAQVEQRGLVRPGVLESVVSAQVRDLAADLFGVSRYWHKRIVRSGPNTLHPYRDNPPDRVIGEDDIAFLDFGPIFSQWEADFGRTFVLGDDPVKHRLRDELEPLFTKAKQFFLTQPDITGETLFAYVNQLSEEAGWEYGGPHAGHLVGEFPHEKVAGDKVHSYIAPGNDMTMRRLDTLGRRCHWILEIHLVDRERGIGGFYEELLTLS